MMRPGILRIHVVFALILSNVLFFLDRHFILISIKNKSERKPFKALSLKALSVEGDIKGTLTRDFRPLVFHQTTPPRPLIHGLKPFSL
jgi:hypothetical protein